MRFKNKWLNRVTAAVLSIGMALTPAVMNSGVTYADVKDIESPITMVRSEMKRFAPSTQTEIVTLGGSKYEITATMSRDSVELQVGEEVELEVTLTANIVDATSSNAIAAVANQFTWVSNASNVDVIEDGTNKAKVVCPEIPGGAFITVGVDIAEAVFVVGTEIIMDESLPEEEPSVILVPLSATIAVRQTVQLTPEFLNSDGLETEVKGYYSDKPEVATVDKDGLVKAVGVGTATITGTFIIDGKEYQETSEIIVTAENTDTPVTPESPEISLDKTNLTLVIYNNVYDYDTLSVKPEGRQYEWKSSDDDIVSVYEDTYKNGCISTGDKVGTAVVTVTDKETKKSASCTINVVKINPLSIPRAIEVGQEVSLNLDIEPAGENIFQYITLTSENPKIIDIVGNTTIKGLKTGTSRLKIRRKNNKHLYLFTVVVTERGKKISADENTCFSDSYFDKIEPDDPEGYLKSLGEREISDLKDNEFSRIERALNLNKESCVPAKNLAESVKLPLKENEKALVYIDSSWSITKIKAVSKIRLYPTELTFEAKPYADIYDAKSGEWIRRGVLIENMYLTGGKFWFRLPIPADIIEKYAQVIHKSEGYQNEKISNLEIKRLKAENAEGDIVDTAYIEIPATHFSTFEVTFTNEKIDENNGSGSSGSSSDGGSGSSGGSSNDSSGSSNGSNSSGSSSSSSSSGGSSRSYTYRGTKKAAQWAQDSRGWRFQNADETYVTNRWIELSWNEKSAWYRFNEQGYMVTGWFKDGDGNWYFMNDRADGTQGAMVTGWHQIAGKWYYFRVTAGGPVGSLVMNATTPDGYKVDGNGVWIQ
ncbi:hypothetical protein DW779_02065 [Clostridium sp. AM30-24]|nr:Ig-like domain-containing protein [Clostridium sp. AM30-24]RHT44770.1 hypothetical protein DW779_02065 [Clostridium sp. AM30-24]